MSKYKIGFVTILDSQSNDYVNNLNKLSTFCRKNKYTLFCGQIDNTKEISKEFQLNQYLYKILFEDVEDLDFVLLYNGTIEELPNTINLIKSVDDSWHVSVTTEDTAIDYTKILLKNTVWLKEWLEFILYFKYNLNEQKIVYERYFDPHLKEKLRII